jgi:hypothetical protein
MHIHYHEAFAFNVSLIFGFDGSAGPGVDRDVSPPPLTGEKGNAIIGGLVASGEDTAGNP